MSFNTFGHIFRVTTWGESHGPALGATVDGCPPGIPLTETDIQVWLDKRKPGQNRYTTQRREADAVEILSGVFEGVTTGTPIQLMIRNTDQRSKDAPGSPHRPPRVTWATVASRPSRSGCSPGRLLAGCLSLGGGRGRFGKNVEKSEKKRLFRMDVCPH